MSKLYTKGFIFEITQEKWGSLVKIITKMELREIGQNVSIKVKNGQNLPTI